MEDLMARFAHVAKGGPYSSDPDLRWKRVEQCEVLGRQLPDVRRSVEQVAKGTPRLALSYETTAEGHVIYLWEHAPPSGFTVRALLLPAAAPAAPLANCPGARRGFVSGAALLLLGAALALGSFWLGREAPWNGPSPEGPPRETGQAAGPAPVTPTAAAPAASAATQAPSTVDGRQPLQRIEGCLTELLTRLKRVEDRLAKLATWAQLQDDIANARSKAAETARQKSGRPK